MTSENRGKEVPSEADVVVIGKNSSHLSLQVFIANYLVGGSLGCQTLYHLAKLGVTNTVLLEKEQLTAGQQPVLQQVVLHPGHLSPLVVRTLEQP